MNKQTDDYQVLNAADDSSTDFEHFDAGEQRNRVASTVSIMECTPECLECELEPQYTCFSCEVGYELHALGETTRCIASVPNCRVQSERYDYCMECDFGFRLSYDKSPFGACVHAVEHCIDVVLRETCTECENGYYGPLCAKCDMNCVHCDTHEGCLACDKRAGFVLEQGKCKKMMFESCIVEEDCVQGLVCTGNYSLTKVCLVDKGGSCQANEECRFGTWCKNQICVENECSANNCSTCLPGNAICLVCKTGFSMNDLMTCEPCPSSCSTCYSESQCFACKSKMFRIVDGRCLLRPWFLCVLGTALVLLGGMVTFGIMYLEHRKRK